MDLFYWKSPAGNFGDDLNLWLWDRLLPGWRGWDPNCLLVGVGTVLNAGLLPERDRYLVIGSGCGFGRPPVIAPPERWDVRCVRGPHTARMLGLETRRAVTDPAAMVSRLPEFAGILCSGEALFLPHCHSDLDPDYDWPSICAKAGLAYQSPCAPAPEVIRRIAASRLVITESMHGAIVADAFRVPWRAVSLTANFNAFKWRDWTASLELTPPEIVPLPRPVRRLRKAVHWIIGRSPHLPAQRTASGAPDAEHQSHSGLKAAGVATLRRLQHRLTVRALRRLLGSEPVLSRDGVTEQRLHRLENILAETRRSYDTRVAGDAAVAAR